ncbi:MAG: coproporphyrinogen-III oxidase family protein [Nanoarchaeota archaeon]|nr:coproporphyrinogen-III oxidase family protein [Nanoarchaeota archaeon]
MRLDRQVIRAVSQFRDAEQYSFVVEYPPPLVRPRISETDILSKSPSDSGSGNPPIEVYVHIPDCPYICDFCSFYKFSRLSEQERDRYVSAVQKEVDIYVERSDLATRTVTSVFFGGGTPTRLSPDQLSRLLAHLAGKLRLSEDVEVTVESSPDTLDNEILESMLRGGVNRLSIGVQDFHDPVLAARHRGHTGQQAIDAYHRARTLGFENINIDLIYRLPQQTLAGWDQNLQVIRDLAPDYATFYHLRKERRTSLGKKKEACFPTKEEAMEMYLRALETLVGMNYLQISPNQFAAPKKEFRQQEHKWHRGSELLGLGASAYSWFNGFAYRNVGRFGTNMRKDLTTYLSTIESGHLAVESGERPTAQEQMRRFALFGLKTSGINRPSGGIDKQLFLERFGVSLEAILGDAIQDLKTKGLVEEDAQTLRLTLGGLLVAEEVATLLYSSAMNNRLKKVKNTFGRDGL